MRFFVVHNSLRLADLQGLQALHKHIRRPLANLTRNFREKTSLDRFNGISYNTFTWHTEAALPVSHGNEDEFKCYSRDIDYDAARDGEGRRLAALA